MKGYCVKGTRIELVRYREAILRPCSSLAPGIRVGVFSSVMTSGYGDKGDRIRWIGISNILLKIVICRLRFEQYYNLWKPHSYVSLNKDST